MATKPTSADFTWAGDTNFSAGPASGQPTKVNPPGWPNSAQGFVPGSGVVAEFMNRVLNVLGQWSGWLNSGSSAGAADAHIVETNSSGSTSLVGLTASGNVTVTGRVTSNGAFTANAAVSLGGVISPVSMGTTETDWSPSGLDGASVIRAPGHASGSSLVSLDAGEGGPRVIVLINVHGSQNITVVNQTGATAENRFALPGNTNIVLPPNGAVTLWYDPTSERWRVFGYGV
jgi:hypothetical protein